MTDNYVVLFDGLCNLCSGSVQFIIKRDPRSHFKFASLQSEYGRSKLLEHGLNPDSLHSIILLKDNSIFQRSDAALLIARKLTGLWPVFYIFRIVPRFLRDMVYNLIARNRYKWFGKKNECWIPTHELKARFLN